MDSKTFGKKLRFYLDSTDSSIPEFATKVGIASFVIESWIDGSSEPSQKALDYLRKVLGSHIIDKITQTHK